MRDFGHRPHRIRRLAVAAAALVATAFALHCGGREGTLRSASTPAGNGGTATTQGPGGGDPLCGVGWKWDGARCTQVEPAAGSATGSRSAVESNGPSEPSGDDVGRATSPPNGGGGTAQLVVRDVTVGAGVEAKAGDNVRIHYVGTLTDGKEFDSSRKRGVPFEFRLGSGQVIKGFERGIIGMKVGGIRQLTIPPELGYGRKGAPPLIPPRATLVFEIELLDVT